MLTIRMQRVGKPKNPTYRFIVSEKHKDTQSGSLEILGNFNPVTQPKQLTLNKERILYWLSKGAQPSATVHNILLKEGLVKGKKIKSVFLSRKRSKKIAEKKKASEPAPAPAAAPAEITA